MNELSNEEATKTNKIHHGCYRRNADGTRALIGFMNGKRCLIPSAEKYWKKPEEFRKKSPRRIKKKSDIAQTESKLKHSKSNLQL